MTWIRSPSWDGFWILSAPLLGVAMLFIPVSAYYVVVGMLALRFAHALSPIALAWTHRGFRGVMLQRPGKYIGAPAFVMLAGVAIAVSTWMLFPDFKLHRVSLENIHLDELGVPFVIWANLYALWNFYHAGAQNFGIFCLYRRKGFMGWRRYALLAICVALTVFVGHEAARIWPYHAIVLFGLGLATVNHWLAAIGLSAHVHANHSARSPLVFVGLMLIAGLLLAVALTMALHYSLRAAMLALSVSAALGIWHFLQDRWIWRLSDPQVRATIGRDLFVLDRP